MAADAPSPIRFFVPEGTQLPRTLRGKLEHEKAERIRAIAGGLAQDWPDYKERIGFLRGVDYALLLCDEIEKEMD